ncbi:MAG: SMI1/KNR4 family protein, partial [Mycobacterium sp.]|nr:SMI1/KNR4 family protein [Mycobacterium sp.]
ADVAEGLREWFDLHDGADWNQGSGDILPFCLLLGMEDSIGQSQLIRQIWTEQEDPSHISAAMAQPAGEIAATWLPAYVMIGDDTCGGGLFIDLRDGERKGCIRFWDKTEADDGAIETSSLTELISGVTDSIRNRTPICQHVATVVDGRINWEFDE